MKNAIALKPAWLVGRERLERSTNWLKAKYSNRLFRFNFNNLRIPNV